MPSFHDTVSLERAFLKSMTSSIVMARTYLHQANEEMFTSEPRRFILALAISALNNSNCLLTRKVYEYEVGARLSDRDGVDFIGEWNLIDGVIDNDPPEIIISKIKQAEVGRKVLTLSENVVEMLQGGQIEEAVAHLKREAMVLGGGMKTDRPLASLVDTKDRLALIRDKIAHPEKYAGLQIGFKTFDEWTGGLFPGELTLIAGVTGLGKSTLCRAIAKGITTLNGSKNVLHIANEEYLEQVQYKYDAIFMGIPYQDFKRARVTEEQLDRWQKYMQEDMQAQGRGQIFIKEVPAFSDISLIEQQYRMLENRGIPIHAIIIDHLPHVKPLQPSWGENDERFKAAVDCKELARWLHLPVITPTQAATEVEKKQNRGQRASKLDVYGSKGQVHVANTFLIITYKGTDDTQTDVEDYLRDVFWLCDAKKNRDGPPFYFMAKHVVKIGEVIEVADPSKKPSKEEQNAAGNVVEEAEKSKGESGPSSVITTNTSIDNTSVVPVSPVTNTGLRDASMQFAEAIDSDDPEDVNHDEEGAAYQNPLSEHEGRVIDEVISGIDDRIEEVARDTGAATRSMLSKIRAKNIPLSGV